MEGVLKIQTLAAGAFSMAALVLASAPAQAATELFSFSDGADGIFANGQFITSDTPNALGTYEHH